MHLYTNSTWECFRLGLGLYPFTISMIVSGWLEGSFSKLPASIRPVFVMLDSRIRFFGRVLLLLVIFSTHPVVSQVALAPIDRLSSTPARWLLFLQP